MVGAVKTDDLIMEEYYMELSMQYGYIRVSSKEQNEDRQYIAMSEFGMPLRMALAWACRTFTATTLVGMRNTLSAQLTPSISRLVKTDPHLLHLH